ncbi:Ssk22p [Saccharomyces cerevisiae x Saccharomyces kudriavzevii VIN7]|uniref:MAP kinase kinase kinase n=1 Tax=Saccharomyces cerevisiae x Saccharomyces kudriavzevii (strain VIN7) TaxID=1095631 RepID=H0GRZ2_SACCK|nr:Ssk22p [Saccharomyces cerevisiae x Saccharomyces kudriavzevii VIN7]
MGASDRQQQQGVEGSRNSVSPQGAGSSKAIKRLSSHSSRKSSRCDLQGFSSPAAMDDCPNQRSFKTQYVINESLYLEKLKKTALDDYYTRGIMPISRYDEDGDDDGFVRLPNGVEIEEELDSGFDFLTGTSYCRKMRLDYDELAQDYSVVERFKWQSMLAKVLKGDIVKSEKTRIANQVKKPGLNTELSDEIWLELKAWLNGKTVQEMARSLGYLRNNSDSLFKEIMEFRIPQDKNLSLDALTAILQDLLDRYNTVVSYWPNLRKMHRDKPIVKSAGFTARVDVINSWLNFKTNLALKRQELDSWINRCSPTGSTANFGEGLNGVPEWNFKLKSLAEQLVKEKDIESVFQKKIFYPLSPWMFKLKLSIMVYGGTLEEMNLKYPYERLKSLLIFPGYLIKEVILTRLSYAQKLKTPTMMMIDQTIDDFNSFIRLAVQLKYTLTKYCSNWPFDVDFDPTFENTVIEAIRYLFFLLNLKLIDSAKKNFKAPDILLKYWDHLKNVGHYIKGAETVIPNEFLKLTLRLIHKLQFYLSEQQDSPPTFANASEAEKWLSSIFENLGAMKRKLNRFSNILTKAFQNSVVFQINHGTNLLKKLKDAGYFLIHSGGKLQSNGIYLLATPELLDGDDDAILSILQNKAIGCDLVPKLDIGNNLNLYDVTAEETRSNILMAKEENAKGIPYYRVVANLSAHLNKHSHHSKGEKSSTTHYDRYLKEENKEILELELALNSLGALVVLFPGEPVVWEGQIYELSNDNILHSSDINLKKIGSPNSLILLNQGSNYALTYQVDKFSLIAGDSVSVKERRCSIDAIESSLQRINKAYYKFTYTVLDNYNGILSSFMEQCPGSELLNTIFMFGRDFGRSFLKNNSFTAKKKSVIALSMVKLSINWLKFLVEDCDPTDQRTFRWCVLAMEFAMQMTNGYNILTLDEEQFQKLKERISVCMSLLISHFDVMGARATETENGTQQARLNIDIEDNIDEEATLQINSKLRLEAIEYLENTVKKNPRQMGKVLDATGQGNKYLLSLASSLSNVSMRWQKGSFIGGGTFGQVYSAINLENGEILAVKEIKMHDIKTMKKIFPLIKEEMTVLEMLNHPNVVQYYGVEVHRDKVNIFMEYCEGGSLASLLDRGRIEDEMVTQVYTLELLEGLVYLHKSGVVHRDIKPENILLDFNGIIKYVDFGTARTVVESSTRALQKAATGDLQEAEPETKPVNCMMGTPMYMAPEAISGSTVKGKLGADDVWALGCVVLEMATGRRPWSNLDNEWAIMYHVAAGHVPQLPSTDEMTPAGRAFLERCLVQDPSMRATATELLVDPWMMHIREIAFGGSDKDKISVASS